MRYFAIYICVGVSICFFGCSDSKEGSNEQVEVPLDEEAPLWSDDAKLSFIGVSDSALVITWTPATDNVGVGAYHIYKNDIEMAVLAGNLTSLQVHQLDASSEYTFRVEAKDAAGNTGVGGPSGTIKTGDESAPSWPDESKLNASEITASGLSLAWTNADDNVAVSGYQIYQDNLEIGSVAADTLTFSVESLDPWRNYTFRIEAEDAVGNRSNSGPTVTVQSLDSSAPTWAETAEIVASNIKPSSLDLGWSPATDDVGVTHYQVLQDKVEIALLPSNTTWLTVTGLSPWTDYEFTVLALDAAGNASSSGLTVTVQTTDESTPTWANDSVLLASNPTEQGITLGWTAAQDGVGVATYRLYQDNVEIGVYDGSTSSAEVSGLTSVLTYLFRVEAEDAAGNLSFGGPSLSVDLSDTTPPSWPENAECLATELTPSSVKLGWSTATDNSDVTAYQVWSDGELVQNVPGDQVSIKLNSLAPLTDYIFTMIALDSVGNVTTDGPSVSISTPDYSQPSWPLDAELTAANLTASSVTLSWSAPVDDQPFASFDIYQDENKVQTVDGAENSALVTGLSALTEYSFRVEAVGLTAKVSDDGPSVSASTPDYPPPTWPEDAGLTVSKLTENSLTLSWDALDTTQTIATYTVIQNAAVLTTVDGSTTTLDVGGLSAGTVYAYTIEAVGLTGLQSTNGPSASATTPDTTAPTWPDGAELTVVNTGSTTVDLSWTAATDNVGITGYKILQNGEEAATVDGQSTTAAISGLTVSTNYNFKVLATDGAGQWTTDGPSAAATTTSGQESLTTEAIFEGLKPQCAVCHTATSNPFFMASLEDFNTLVVQDSALVTPGDPDTSELIHLLEGNGSGDFKTMPTFGGSFKEQSAQGKTDITIEEIRYWIQVMN